MSKHLNVKREFSSSASHMRSRSFLIAACLALPLGNCGFTASTRRPLPAISVNTAMRPVAVATNGDVMCAGDDVRSRSCSQQIHVQMRIPIVDDVLDYLTNKGGYTGFTEEQLKSGKSLTEDDVANFGKELETDETITTVFVLLLIATPFIVGYIGFTLGVFVEPSFVKF